MTVVSPSFHLCFLPTSYREEVPTSPFLEFDEFARAAHKTQRNISLTRWPYWFVTKGHNWGTARGRDAQAKTCRKSMELPCPLLVGHSHQICLSNHVYQPRSSPFGVLWRLHYIGMHDWLNHWLLVTEVYLQPLSPPWMLWSGTECSHHLITWLVSLPTSHHP